MPYVFLYDVVLGVKIKTVFKTSSLSSYYQGMSNSLFSNKISSNTIKIIPASGGGI